MLKRGQMVIFRGPQSHSNGHFEQPAVVTHVWSETCVNLNVLPDCDQMYAATSVEVFPDETAAVIKVNQMAAHEPPLAPNVCWPA